MKYIFIIGSLTIIVIVAILIFQSNGSNEEQSTMEQADITFDTIRHELDSSDAVLIDVRTPAEYEDGHVAPAVNLPLQNIQTGTMPDATTDQHIYLYCRTGSRSAQAAGELRQAGYTVTNLGGLQDMIAIGAEITP